MDDSSFREGVLAILECPICFEIMQPPINLCSTGHSLCSKCISNISTCPVCKSTIENSSRNYSLEKLSQLFGVQCCYSHLGCDAKLPNNEVAQHERRCSYRLLDCPMSKDTIVQCSWNGRHRDVLNHVKENHPSKVFSVPIGQDFYLAPDFYREYFYDVVLLYSAQNAFVSHDFYDEEQMKYWKAIQYYGTDREASEFQYFIELLSHDKSMGLKYHATVHSKDDDIQEVIRTDACFTVSKQQLQHFIQDGVALTNIRIDRIASDSFDLRL